MIVNYIDICRDFDAHRLRDLYNTSRKYQAYRDANIVSQAKPNKPVLRAEIIIVRTLKQCVGRPSKILYQLYSVFNALMQSRFCFFWKERAP